MALSGTATVDHHQFVIGARSAETYEPSASGSVIEVGANFVTILTGIAYGPVQVTVQVVDEEPRFEPESTEWDVVEQATLKVTKALDVITLGGEKQPNFDRVPITRGLHTFRVSARGRDAHQGLDVTESTEHYLVQVWRVTRPSDMVRLRMTDQAWSRDIETHPTRNWWDPDPAADATLYLKYGYDQMAEWAKDEARQWGGRPPSEKLRRCNAIGLAHQDRALADALTRAKADKLISVAAWAARRAYTIAGLAEIEWIRPALDALDRGQSVPHPFGVDDRVDLYAAMLADPQIATEPSGHPSVPPQIATRAQFAMYTIPDASNHDSPMQTAFDCLYQAARADDENYESLVRDLRATFFPRLMPIEKYERWI